MRITRSFAIAALLLGVAATGARADEIRVTLRGDGPMRIATVQVPGIGDVIVRAQEKDKLIWIEAVDAEGSVIGRAQSVAGVAETPLSVSGATGRQKLVVVFEGAR